MNYTTRYQQLNTIYKMGTDIELPETGVRVLHYNFTSNLSSYENRLDGNGVFNDQVPENTSFIYPVFVPEDCKIFNEAILLMHGLNERNWAKYLTWAEYLCVETNKPVILFPIAFHINRTPVFWSNPRMLKNIFEERRKSLGNDRTVSFANVALSERISQNPLRFYASGRQTLNDMANLYNDIKSGKHSLFSENTHIDIFAYSIGAFLSQIAFMTNPANLFADSKLFMFCGGSIFSSMFGQSRGIMDKEAFNTLLEFYEHDFSDKNVGESFRDKALRAFNSMISPERNRRERTGFFKKMGSRLSGVSLRRDFVIPYRGIEKALGEKNAHSKIDLIDFDFEYTHENPFPTTGLNSQTKDVDKSFNLIFGKAAGFLAT